MVDERGRVWDAQKRTGCKKSRELRLDSRGRRTVGATRSRGGLRERGGERKKRRVGVLSSASGAITGWVGEGGWCVAGCGCSTFQTVAADDETCLLSERSAQRVEDGGRGRRGEGSPVVRANGRQRLCHTLSLIWQLPISSPSIDWSGTHSRTNKIHFFSLVLRGHDEEKETND